MSAPTEDAIINRVAGSGLITIDLEELYHPGERVLYDLKQNLFQELLLREKDFREFLKTHDWAQYTDKNVAITCTADAIVPSWAYMLLATHLAPYAHMVAFGTLDDLENALFRDALARIKPEDYRDAKVVVKGCSKHPVPLSAYVEISRKLQPVVASLMYGEPCSTVPIYKRKKS